MDDTPRLPEPAGDGRPDPEPPRPGKPGLARMLLIALYASLGLLSLTCGIVAVGEIFNDSDAALGTIFLLFTALQVIIMFYAIRHAWRSGSTSTVVAGGALVVLLWLVSIGLCGLTVLGVQHSRTVP